MSGFDNIYWNTEVDEQFIFGHVNYGHFLDTEILQKAALEFQAANMNKFVPYPRKIVDVEIYSTNVSSNVTVIFIAIVEATNGWDYRFTLVREYTDSVLDNLQIQRICPSFWRRIVKLVKRYSY